MKHALVREVKVEPFFSICITKNGSYKLTEASSTLEIELDLNQRPFYVQRHLFSKSAPGKAALPKALKEQAQRFVSDGMAPVLGRMPKASLEGGVVDGVAYEQIVVEVSKTEWWIARIASRPSLSSFYLMHWLGSRIDAELSVSAMVTFKILEEAEG